MALDPSLTEFTTASQAIASYDYTDIADGLGYQIYYAFPLEKNGTYFLSPTFMENEGILPLVETDYDLSPFNIAQTVKGTAYLETYTPTGAGAAVITARLYRVRGVTETAVSSAITSISQAEFGHIILEIPLTETDFAAGDFLRLTLTNAKNVQITSDSTNPCKLHIPFRLDL